MRRTVLWIVAAVFSGALAACTNPAGDDTTSCSELHCAIAICASQGAPGGRCLSSSCSCDGARTGTCDVTQCATACRNYAGATGGTCTSRTNCECSGVTDGGTDTGFDVPPGAHASIHGQVLGPGGLFPVAGAIVYVQRTTSAVAALPEGNYCQRCLDVTALPHAESAADGTFRIDGIGLGDWWLVVHKGQFRRVRQISLRTDGEDLPLPLDTTTLPNEHAPAAGDTVPHIAVALGVYDHPEDLLAKIEMAELMPDFRASLATADFDLYDNGYGGGYPPMADLVQSRFTMDQYQLIFVPCTDETNDSLLGDPTVRENIRGWVEDGGKWFVTDRSYEWIEWMFPAALDMEGDDSVIGAADQCCSYDATGRILDDDMGAWLSGLGTDPSNVPFRELWDNVCGVGTIMGLDEDGHEVPVPVTVFAEGPQSDHPCSGGNLPYTASFLFGCGRILYSTYHTVGEMEGPHPSLYPQELMLLYLAMEIGVCTDDVIIW
ncbi:MAG: hypothetical protein HY905_25070 [Deltaproteobacteria bacterium]|nr:hypothetical protein [Deltaproteobacteria bacterium]